MRPSWSEHPTALQTQVGDSRATTWLRRYMDNAAWGVDEVQRLHSAAVRYGGSSGPEGGGQWGQLQVVRDGRQIHRAPLWQVSAGSEQVGW